MGEKRGEMKSRTDCKDVRYTWWERVEDEHGERGREYRARP